mgnify:CR=1 FL=1
MSMRGKSVSPFCTVTSAGSTPQTAALSHVVCSAVAPICVKAFVQLSGMNGSRSVTVMRSAMEPLLQSPLLRLELARVQQSPMHGLLAGVCMTLTVQSSSATVALLQSMAAQPGADGVHSLLGLTAAIPILLGDNIGTTITAVLAAIGQGRDAKRVAAAHAIFNLSGAAVCCALLQPFAALVRLCSPAGAECAVIARQIANAHTLFNVLCALVWLPLTGQMVRLVCALLPDKNRPEERL